MSLENKKMPKLSTTNQLIIDKSIHEILKSDYSDQSFLKHMENINKIYNSHELLKLPRNLNYREYQILKFNYWDFLFKNRYFNTTECLRHLNCITKNKEQYKIWDLLSHLVLNRKSINFPILYYYDNLENMFFEQYTANVLNPLYTAINQDISEQILFQKILILYNLYINNLSCINYKFDIINIPEMIINFKIKSLHFTFKIKYLVLLSPTNYLVNTSSLERTYLECLGIDELYFINTLLKRFITKLNIEIYQSTPSLNLYSENLINPERGDLGIIKTNNGNSSSYCIVNNVLGTKVSILLIQVNNKIMNLVEIQNQDISNLYKVYNVYNNSIFNSIG